VIHNTSTFQSILNMPELPEVEVTRLSIVDPMTNAKITDVVLGKPLRWPLSCDPQMLMGQRVKTIRRRSKYLLLDLERGLLLVHLGMSGSLRFASELGPMGAHDHFELQTDKGSLRLHDPRRFGAVVYARSQDDPVAQKLLGHLGVEPLESGFESEYFFKALKSHVSAIKPLLMAGKVVVGVGNIYASEALFMAAIRPTLPAHRISKPRAERLRLAIIEVLTRAVKLGGSSLRDFSNADGQSGYFQLQTHVYDRQGQACKTCQTPIKVIRQAQRSTFYCPTCQKR
jgi:formamidopyrimidine-DNA glycosylase